MKYLVNMDKDDRREAFTSIVHLWNVMASRNALRKFYGLGFLSYAEWQVEINCLRLILYNKGYLLSMGEILALQKYPKIFGEIA